MPYVSADVKMHPDRGGGLATGASCHGMSGTIEPLYAFYR